MSELLQFVMIGLGVGALYALTAQGLVLIYRGSGVVNFAQGAFGMIGAFVFYDVRDERGWGSPAAWVLGIGVTVVLAALTHLLLMRRLRRASPLVRLVATLGVFSLLLAVAEQIWGNGTDPALSPLPTTVRYPFGDSVPVSEDRLWLLGIGIVVTTALWALFKFTRFGHATEAVAENPTAASALGFSPDAIATANWALGGALAAVTGILIAPILFLSVVALGFAVLRGLAAALVGQFRSFWLTLAGALGIGVVESVLSRFIEDKGAFGPITNAQNLVFGHFSAQAVSRSSAFLIIVILLVFSGKALPLRSELLDRLPALGTGRVRWAALLPAVLVMGVAVATVSPEWNSALAISMAMAIICLSLVVVTGYVGQLSLAQLALAGLGAWAAGRMADAHGAAFPLALVVGVAVTVPIGLLFAIPALRTRGINLAVLTFGLSVMVVEMVLNNAALTGGLEGTHVGSPSLFGLDVDAFEHPDRYAYVCLALLVICALAVANLRRGASGRRFVAVRDNERAAASLGISVYGVKLFAFAIAAGLAAVGGVLLAFRQDAVAFEPFAAFGSLLVVVIAVIGGIGFVIGALIGGAMATGGLLSEVFKHLGDHDDLLNLFSGSLLIITLVVNPNGIADGWTRLAARIDAARHARWPSKRSRATVELPAAEAVARRERTIELAVEGLTVCFGNVVAVNDLSFEVRPGEVLGLIGPNGAGKTTVIDAVTGFVKPSEGTIRLGDRPVERWAAHRRVLNGIGRSFQSLELFDDLTVGENILAACDTRSPLVYFGDLVRPRTGSLSPVAAAAIREFGLEDDLEKHPSELSYGNRRLVAVARAVATDPDILLLDEPAAGLGEAESAELGRLVTRLAKEWGIGILMIEHDVDLVMSICDRIVAIDFGTKLAQGTPEEVASDGAVIASYLGEHEPDAEFDELEAELLETAQ